MNQALLQQKWSLQKKHNSCIRDQNSKVTFESFDRPKQILKLFLATFEMANHSVIILDYQILPVWAFLFCRNDQKWHQYASICLQRSHNRGTWWLGDLFLGHELAMSLSFSLHGCTSFFLQYHDTDIPPLLHYSWLIAFHRVAWLFQVFSSQSTIRTFPNLGCGSPLNEHANHVNSSQVSFFGLWVMFPKTAIPPTYSPQDTCMSRAQ